ncbi:hypothetical protein H0E87_027429, partial [Populus deltoides]
GLRENPSRISLTTSPQPGRSPVKTQRTSWVKTTGPTRIHPVGIEVRLTVLDSKEKATLVVFVQQYLDGVIGKQNSQQLKIQEEASIVNLPSSEEGMLSNPFGNFEGTPGTRRKKDVGWKHCEMLRNEKRVQIKCNYCAKLFKGGGIHRFKEHLAGRNSSGVRICTRVPSNVRVLMQQHLSPIVAWQRKKRKSNQEKLHNVHSLPSGEDLDIFADHSDEVNTSPEAAAGCNLAEVNSDFLLDEEGTSNENLGKRKSRGGKTTSAIALAAAHDADALMGPGLEKADNAIHVTMGRFLYDIGASLDALDSSFFQPLIDAVFSGQVDGNKKQIPEDPISFDNISIIEDWITQNDLSLEDYGSSDWMSLVPPSVNTMPLVPSTDESEDVATGFDDFEIFNGLKEV